jgi:flavin reductase (DIM6/NTAB) family NADH-FMN oxidoreductase RutF
MAEAFKNDGSNTNNNDKMNEDLEAYDRLRRRIMWLIPNGIFMLGTKGLNDLNLMTLSWMTQVAAEPKAVVISCEINSLSYKNIKITKNFVVSILNKEDKKPAIVFAKPAVYDPIESTLSGFKFFKSENTGCPVISSAVAYLEFEVIESREFESHAAIFARVINAKELMEPGVKLTKEIILSMQDTKMNYGG